MVGIALAVVPADRFPGKTILPLAGIPLWHHVCRRIEKLAEISGIELKDVGIGTNTRPENDILEQQARSYGYSCWRVEGLEDVPGEKLMAMDSVDGDYAIVGSCDHPMSYFAHLPPTFEGIWENNYPAVMRWKGNKISGDPSKTVVQVVGTLGIEYRWNMEYHKMYAQNDDELAAAVNIVLRDPEFAYPPFKFPSMLYDGPDELWELHRYWNLEVDNYEDGVMNMLLFDKFFDIKKDTVIDVRKCIEFIDKHPEMHYNKERRMSAINTMATSMSDNSQQQRFLDYCKDFLAPRWAQKLYCKECNEYIGYIEKSSLRRPDGAKVKGRATLYCSRGHATEWKQ
jgi:hypothetical protein